MATEKSAGAIVFRRIGKEIKYLILHYGAGHWEFVKGHIEKGEKEEQTVLRELREETGITNAEFVPDFRKEISYYFKDKGQTVYKTVVFYLLETIEENVTLSDEHIGHKWANLSAALKTLTFDNSKQIIQQADDFLKKLPRAAPVKP